MSKTIDVNEFISLAEHGLSSCLEFFLSTGIIDDPDVRSPEDPTRFALSEAIYNRKMRCVEVLLNYGADPNGVFGPSGTMIKTVAQTIVFYRPTRDCREDWYVIAQLLMEAGADPTSESDDGTSALGIARGADDRLEQILTSGGGATKSARS